MGKTDQGNKRETDEELTRKVKEEGCSESLSELINRHSPLCNSIYGKFAKAMGQTGAFPEDILDDKSLIIFESAKSYDPTKPAKFSSWLGNQVRYRCLNAMKKYGREISIENCLNLYKMVLTNLML